MSWPKWMWWKRTAPPGWVYCHGCGESFVHIDGCWRCETDAYLEEAARYS